MAKVLATDLTFAIQASTDLANWVISDPFTMVSEISNGDGKTAISIWRSNAPVTSSGLNILRERISLTTVSFLENAPFYFLLARLGFDSMEGLDDRRRPAEGGSLSGIEAPQVWLVQALRHGHVKPIVLSKGVIKQFGEIRHVCSHLLARLQVADVFSLRSENLE